jgi:hypothetical protein
MGRLTHARSNGIKEGYWSPNKKEELVKRLAEYENTGLSPEEVEELRWQQRRYHWIPVGERLPEEDERVIISTKNEVVKEGAYTERYGYAMRKGFFTENCFEDLQGVTAWQPLPESYKGGQNET